MTLSLTCACGALLEIDDKFAGQTINCPDCQRKLQAPARDAGRRTSGFALASLVCALVGAFTVVGTVLAVALGAFALWDIKRKPDRLVGRGFARAGIVAGVLLTGLTVYAYTSADFFGLDSIGRQGRLAGRVDYPKELELLVEKDAARFSIVRPSARWGKLREDPLSAREVTDHLVLVNPREDAHVLCRHFHVGDVNVDMETKTERALEKFRDSHLLEILGGQKGALEVQVRSVKELPPEGDIVSAELILDTKPRGRERVFLMRLFRRKDEAWVYLIAGGARKDRFERLEPQLRQAIESFKPKS